jgi:hypothetical protein
MSYHGLLDWRLGMALLRCFNSSQFQSGVDNNFSHPELEGWINSAQSLRATFVASFQACKPEDFAGLPGFDINGRKVILIHPLWDQRQPRGILAHAVAVAGDGARFIDTFNVLRRMSSVYQWLAA